MYQQTAEALEWAKIILEQGGSRSSKTFSIFQIFINKAMEGEGFTLTIARDKLTWIKTTLLKDFEEILGMYGDDVQVTPNINVNRPEQVYYVNGSEFAFFGLDYPQKLHGRKQDYFWLNEVMEINKMSFDQLEMRTSKQGILDYNPSDDMHWVHDLKKRPDVALIKSTVLDNPFVGAAERAKILSYEPTEENIKNGTADPFMWSVYGLGEAAQLKGLIYTNWDIMPLPRDEDGNITAKFLGNGLDFGYSVDPTALVGMYMQDNEIWFDERLYETELVNSSPVESEQKTIVKKFQTLGVSEYELVVGDSSEPKSIAEIKAHRYNIEGALKGQDSVNYGIDLLKGYKVHITPRSINLDRERRRYKWREDANGNPVKDAHGHNVPIDDFNHGLDAARYIAMKKLQKKIGVKLYSDASEFGL